ncbi:MAG: hypothetical protein AAGA30_08720, partial [Planctomycetota bacterium]
TSIEPVEEIHPQIVEIAAQNQCQLDFSESFVVNAPFCGIDYNAEDFHLRARSAEKSQDNINQCICDLIHMESKLMADGFFEVISPVTVTT